MERSRFLHAPSDRGWGLAVGGRRVALVGVRVVVAVALVLGVQSDGGGRRGGVVGRRRGEVTGGTGETAALATRWRTGGKGGGGELSVIHQHKMSSP